MSIYPEALAQQTHSICVPEIAPPRPIARQYHQATVSRGKHRRETAEEEVQKIPELMAKFKALKAPGSES